MVDPMQYEHPLNLHLNVVSDTTQFSASNQLPDLKYDDGKVLASIMYEDFPDACLAIAEIGTYGAKKYKRNSWKTVSNRELRYKDAMHRHALARARGEVYDKESGLRHTAHFAWNALALLQIEIEDYRALKEYDKKLTESNNAQLKSILEGQRR